MNNNNLSGIIAGAVIVLIVILGVLLFQGEKDTIEKTSDDKKDGGALYIGITDATADIKNVNEVNMEVKKVEVYNTTRGWTTVSSNNEKYDLLRLKAEGKTKFYAKEEIEAGVYDRVRVTIGDTVIKTKTKGDVKAYSPSSQVVLNILVNVNSEKDTYVELDFLADKSLHVTSNGEYIFAPVVKATSQSNTAVNISSENVVTTTGGTRDASVSVGVDLSGSSKKDFVLDTKNDIKIDSSAIGATKFILNGQTYVESKTDQETSVESKDTPGSGSSSVKTDGSVKVDLQ